MPKGPVQHRLLVAQGPFGALSPRSRQIALRNVARRAARVAAAIARDAAAGNSPSIEFSSGDEDITSFLEPLTDDENSEDEESDDGVLGIDLSNNQAAHARAGEHDSEVEGEEENAEHEDVEDTTQNNQHSLLAAPAPVSVPAPVQASTFIAINTTAQNPLQCPYCNKVFVKDSIRRLHISDRHVGTTCHWPGCGTVTAAEQELIKHFITHQREAVAQGWDCKKCPWPNCGKVFSRKDSVQRCLKKHNAIVGRG